jgi:hypothetical protein
LRLRDVVVGVMLLVVAATVADRCHRKSVSEWEVRVIRAEEQIKAERARTEAAKQEAAAERAFADSIAAEIKAHTPEILERIVRVREDTPEHLRDEPAILARDSIITDLRVVVTQWQDAYEAQRRALELLERALVDVEASRDSLAALLKDRPGERPWYVPQIGVGPFAGVCAGGTPCAGPVAVSLTWKIRL